MWIIWVVLVAAVSLMVVSVFTDEPGYFMAGALIIVATAAVYFVLVSKDEYSATNAYCLDSGYTEPYKKAEVWYCLDFGKEPRIMRVPDDVTGNP